MEEVKNRLGKGHVLRRAYKRPVQRRSDDLYSEV